MFLRLSFSFSNRVIYFNSSVFLVMLNISCDTILLAAVNHMQKI